MIESVARVVAEGFYKALASCDMSALGSYLDDDVVWTIGGPVDILPFCGRHMGRANVIEMLDSPMLMDRWRMVLASVLVDGEHAAAVGKLVARRRAMDHSISYRLGLFSHFRGGKLIDHTSIIDSFDAVEQVLGHSLAVPAGNARQGGRLVAV